MSTEENKCVMIIDSNLPLGLIANTSAILGITLGHKLDSIIGEDLMDASQTKHHGITNIPIPILNGSPATIHELLGKIKKNAWHDLVIVDFSNTAQTCKDYQIYKEKVQSLPSAMFQYLGIGIYGSSRKINKLTGNMPLLR